MLNTEAVLEINLLALRPKRNRQWETSQSGLAVILIPKFGNHRVGSWIMSRMAKPNYRVNLDNVGTFVWQHLDGSYNLQEISERLVERFGDEVQPVQERLMTFLETLDRAQAIAWS